MQAYRLSAAEPESAFWHNPWVILEDTLRSTALAIGLWFVAVAVLLEPFRPSVMAHACNLSTQKAEAGGLL